MRQSIIICLGLLLTATVVAQDQKEGKVEVVNGKPAFIINGQPVNPLFYSLTDVPGGRWSWEELPQYNLKTFCRAGFQLFQVDLFLDHAWKEDGTIDMDITRKQLRGVLDACSNATIFIRFHVNPPRWWQKQHPEENTVYADTNPMPDYEWGVQRIIEDDEENPTRFSLASQKWLDEVTPKIKSYLEMLATLPEGNAVAGIQVASGVYGEWHYWGFIENEPDISEPMQRYFRNWLKGKYKTDKNLQTAWNDKRVTLTTARVPGVNERVHTGDGIFRNPLQERKVVDYYEAQHVCVADDIIYFCKLVKDHWPRPIITGAFYGYFYAVFGREAAGGHLELQRVLNSAYVDYLSGPGTYYPDAVQPGDAYRSRGLVTSVRLHKKLWLDEMDQQAPLVPLKDSTFTSSVAKSIGTVRRNVIFPFVNGQGLWFYDFGSSGFNGGKRLQDHGSWGWWDEPTLMSDIAALKKLLDQKFTQPFKRAADVLLVHDTKSFYYTGSARNASYMGHRANNWIPPAIFKSGVVHDVIHIDDLRLVDLNAYRVIVFVNTWTMDDALRKYVVSTVAKQGRHLVFVYAPAYSNEKGNDKKFVEEIVGMKMKMTNDDIPKAVMVENKKITVSDRPVRPFFTVVDDKAQSLGKVDGTSDTGFARKDFADHTSWFISLPPTDPAFWRHVFNEGKAHIYNDQGDVIYEGSGILAIHTNAGGQRKIKLKNNREIDIYLKPYSTTLLDTESGSLLSGERP
ncbi:MAG TPA: hypothetical protein VK658_16225 [Chryseolinea sp.]|nr:hypothetical protein [Chryseolinea sp.]